MVGRLSSISLLLLFSPGCQVVFRNKKSTFINHLNKSDFSLIEFPVEEGLGVLAGGIVARNSSAFVINDLDNVIICGVAGSLACGEVMLFVV